MTDLLKIKVGGDADYKGHRTVLLTYGVFVHRDKFDLDSEFQRDKYLDRVVPKIERLMDQAELYKNCSFQGTQTNQNSPVGIEIKQKLIEALEDAENNPQSLWQPEMTSMADIAPIEPEWFWTDYIPAGAITVLDGDPGLGKSQATIDITARCTRGDAMPPLSAPDLTYPPGCVLLTNCEDDPARVIRPRLDAAGARIDRVHLLREMDGFDGAEKRPVSLPGDLATIEVLIVEKKIILWVIDPWVAYLDGKLSMNNDSDVRRCLGQLAAMAERTGVAVLLVRHLNKKTGSHAIYRGGGSIGITGAARSVLMVGQDPADSDSRILAPVKSNLGPEPPSLRFSIESLEGTSRVVWGDSCDVKACDLLKQDGKPSGGSKQQQAESIINDILGNGPRGENEVLQACEDAGISKATYWRARQKLEVQSEKVGFNDGWMLSLPSNNGVCHEF
ncbi:AAA family ATPase [Bythopirellula goksoeyrii]|uniref:DNA repair protein RadA n=1 Tax=Bythopirellula goksoeyrii TaxID=1400387 RepID=A0A5B9Q805_9BACT|nr:AAA family ATPase [Bythopirellula goksoeyrii]QEG35118.1 hypothetical protein Pr1d_24090 [Bythopirellula goksoeyrii]